MIEYSASTRGFYLTGNAPDDAVEITQADYDDLFEGQRNGMEIVPDARGYPTLAKPTLTPEALQERFTAQIQQRLDDFAKTRNYDGILSAASYATSSNPKFATEGQYCVEVRDATWAAAYAILDEVLAGKRPMPESLADIEADLPPLAWPPED